MPEDVMQRVDKYTEEADFDPEIVKKQSLFACHLWNWVHAIENFHELYRDAKPYDQKRRRAERAYAETVA